MIDPVSYRINLKVSALYVRLVRLDLSKSLSCISFIDTKKMLLLAPSTFTNIWNVSRGYLFLLLDRFIQYEPVQDSRLLLCASSTSILASSLLVLQSSVLSVD